MESVPASYPSARRDAFDVRVAGIASLGEPARRALYRYVVTQPAPVTREQAAEGAGVAHHVAKFHLDKLVDDGLLEVEARRPPGRGGPGAGRPARHYRRSSRQVEVSLPDRRYDLAGRLLAQAVVDSDRDGVSVAVALRQAARVLGQHLGQDARRRAGRRPSRKGLATAAREVLDEVGYEPRVDGRDITLANCPFHALSQAFTELVCGMNVELLSGVVAGLGSSDLDACLDPVPGMCCVRLRGRARGPAAPVEAGN